MDWELGNAENKEADLSTDETSDKENEINDASNKDEKEKIPLAEYVYYWTEKLNFNENMLFLMMMNLDKILNSKKIILNEKNIENVLFTCMIITQKYYEDVIFSDKDYSKLLNIESYKIPLNLNNDIINNINFRNELVGNII